MDIINSFEEAEKLNRGKLTRRFISGILIGFLCAMLVISGTALYLVYRTRVFNQVLNEPSQEESLLLTDKTTNKIKALEEVIDTFYYKTDVDKSEEANGLYRGLMDSLGDPYSVYYTTE